MEWICNVESYSSHLVTMRQQQGGSKTLVLWGQHTAEGYANLWGYAWAVEPSHLHPVTGSWIFFLLTDELILMEIVWFLSSEHAPYRETPTSTLPLPQHLTFIFSSYNHNTIYHPLHVVWLLPNMAAPGHWNLVHGSSGLQRPHPKRAKQILFAFLWPFPKSPMDPCISFLGLV